MSRARASSLVLAASCLVAGALASIAACKGTDDVHQTSEARSKACFDCHSTAYAVVKTPLHVGVYPTTCNDCHATTAWVPATQGHPEAKFPIRSGSHANPAIGCADCHVAALGSDVGGENTDCVHCHIGAHTAPAVDALHAGVAGYPGTPASPHSCLAAGCHPSG